MSDLYLWKNLYISTTTLTYLVYNSGNLSWYKALLGKVIFEPKFESS